MLSVTIVDSTGKVIIEVFSPINPATLYESEVQADKLCNYYHDMLKRDIVQNHCYNVPIFYTSYFSQ
jgi:hypothetical protein